MHPSLVPLRLVSVSLSWPLVELRSPFPTEQEKPILWKPFWIPRSTSMNSMETSINLNRGPLQRQIQPNPKSCRMWWTKSQARVDDRESVSRMSPMSESQCVLLPVVREPKQDSIRLEIPSVDLPYRKRSECSDSPGTRTSPMSQLKKLDSTLATALW